MPGGTAGALRHEVETGHLLSQTGHYEKAVGRMSQLTKFLNTNISQQDRQVAQQLFNELKSAVDFANNAKR